MTSLSCLAAAFLTKGVTPVVSFMPRLSTAARQCCNSRNIHNLASHQLQLRPFSSAPMGLAATAASSVDDDTVVPKEPPLVPITLLSGFLGSGKTTTLQHLLDNKDGLKIGVIVNDMSSVNIDAKLVRKSGSADVSSDNDGGGVDTDTDNRIVHENGVIELQNGCACCSLADELLPAVEALLETKTNGGETTDTFDAVVVELSGVGDPVAIQQNWKAAQANGHPVTKKADMKRIVTLIDSSTFGTDWMTWDNAGERDGWVDENDDCAAGRKVPELLAEQIESADILLLNKIDIAGPEQVAVAAALARSINDKAILEEVEFGKVTSPKQIIRDDRAVVEAEAEANDDDQIIDEGNTTTEPSCTDADCNSHDHSHSHESHAAATKDESSSSECTDSDCTDESHDHSHSHNTSPTSTEDESSSAACTDSDCTDDSHDHSHSHASSSPTSTENLGIVSFVYKADRPFETRNLMSILNTWPVPIKEDLEGLEHFKPASAADDSEPAGRESPFFGVLRSKGFCWLAPTVWKADQGDQWRHDTAMYWSHAGKHFGITTAGKWWATLDESKMKGYFQNDPKQYERILKEDFVSERWGDRRQEIVFIGVNIDEEKITKALDDCLIGDKGMERYSQQLNNFMNTLLTVPVTGGKGGLFDVGNYDNLDV